jgi:hypothetical protein
MKKPITIGVIAVIATILITSAVDYSAIGAKPLDPIHLEMSKSTNVGVMSCPNGDTLATSTGSLHFTENIEGTGGYFEQSSDATTAFGNSLWSGNIQSGQFTFTGIGNPSQTLSQFCDESFPPERAIVTVWGKCGQDVAINFESELGYSGSFTGNVLCV